MEAARQAGPADVAEVAALARRLRREMVGERGAVLWALEARQEPLEASLGELHLVVGTIEDVIVGYGGARVDELAEHTRLAVVEELYVQPEAREIGVGEAILTALVTWATTTGCHGIDAVVLPGLRSGKNLFERFGMSARLIVTHRVVP